MVVFGHLNLNSTSSKIPPPLRIVFYSPLSGWTRGEIRSLMFETVSEKSQSLIRSFELYP